ncbi:MAG: hypothetical protein A2Z27_03185 [candidate division Zixibacteria bacterium RBG_16_50_21]|nr:MAG: hypothetical protein A2Z27_03185 [candidate division Zixibacteria bacterium RBG_16_50_21]
MLQPQNAPLGVINACRQCMIGWKGWLNGDMDPGGGARGFRWVELIYSKSGWELVRIYLMACRI